jgi:hypothetical protein
VRARDPGRGPGSPRSAWRTSIRPIFAAALFLLLPGCLRQPHPLSIDYTIYYLEPPASPVSTNVLLVADNQFHYLYSGGTRLRNATFDLLVQTAIRPAQLDLYSADVVRWVIGHFGADRPVIHLGDAADLSCTSELETFFDIMSNAKKGWVMAPGNHDGYYYGNAHLTIQPIRRNLLLTRGDWEHGCRRGGEPLTRPMFIRGYLDAVSRQSGAGFVALRRYLAEHSSGAARGIPSSGDWRYTGGEPSLLQAATWHIDEARPWRSWIIQEVSLSSPGAETPITAILLDTNSYDRMPVMVPNLAGLERLEGFFNPPQNAGLTGSFTSGEVRAVQRLLELPRTPRHRFVFMGHHPRAVLERAARRSLDAWRKKYALTYISAHTHYGRYYVWGADGHTWLELNVGSVIDWPAEFRGLQFVAPEGEDRIVMNTPLYRLETLWRQQTDDAPRCRPEWEAKPSDPDFYLAYMDYSLVNQRAGMAWRMKLLRRSLRIFSGRLSPELSPAESNRRLLSVLFSATERLLRTAPTRESRYWPPCCNSDAGLIREIHEVAKPYVAIDRKLEFLLELRQFDQVRVPLDPRVRRDFRLCQAIFASKYEYHFARQPQVSDEVVAFPKDGMKEAEATAAPDGADAGTRTDGTGTGQAGTGQAGSGQAGTGQAGTGQTGTGQAGTGQTGTGQAGTGQAGTGQAGTGQAGTAQAGTGQTGTGQAGTGQAGTGQAGTGQAGTGQAGTTGAGNAGAGTDPLPAGPGLR